MARRRSHDGGDRPGSDATAPARASSGRRHPACECGLAATDRVTGRTAGIRYAARGRRARGAIPDPVPPCSVISGRATGVPAGWAADHGSRNGGAAACGLVQALGHAGDPATAPDPGEGVAPPRPHAPAGGAPPTPGPTAPTAVA